VRRFLALAACVLLPAAPAAAHPAPFSYLDLRIDGGALEGSLVLHVIDVAHDLGLAEPSELLDPAAAARERERIIALIAPRLALRTGGAGLPLEWGRIEPAPERDAVRLAFRATGPAPAAIAVRPRLFPYDPFHQTFLNVYEEGSLRQQAVFNATDGERVYYRGTAQGRAAVAAAFVPAGIHHILIGPDHILFLVGLLLLGGGPWRLVRIVTAFTLGHSLTLSLAATGAVDPPASIVEPVIALSIVFVGADNLLVGARGRDVRAWIALAFGLVHGFGFAGVLRELGLPAGALAWSLFSFNLGVEIGQVLIVLLVAGALALVARRDRAAADRLAYAGSMAIVAAGAYWFVQRVFFAGGA
jgi:hypothetical protein